MISFDKINAIKGNIVVAPDKSITHRALLLSAMAEGTSHIFNPLKSADTLTTVRAIRELGVSVEEENNVFKITSLGYTHFIEPDDIINCDNSGTTARLLAGVLAGGGKFFVISGDNSLRNRPMDRVINPLKKLGANIYARSNNKYLPMTILPAQLKGSTLISEVESAQVKSALLLAGLQTNEGLTYVEKVSTRNHTEIMLPTFCGEVDCLNGKITVKGRQKLKGATINVPGDFSSAAFFLAAALLFEGSSITIKDCGLNKTRTAFLKVLEHMGAKYNIEYKCNDGEPFGDLYIEWSEISGIKIDKKYLPGLIDEIPIIAMLGLFTKTPVKVRDASELRRKESDRIYVIVKNFRNLGANVDEYEDGFIIYPLSTLKNNVTLSSFSDHRIAMINILLAKKFGKHIALNEIDSINVSNPLFLKQLEEIEVK